MAGFQMSTEVLSRQHPRDLPSVLSMRCHEASMADDRHEKDTPSHESSKTTRAISEAYAQAYQAAQPDRGRTVVLVELEAREVDWEFVPGRQTRAWGFGGTVPGPTIEAQVGDVLEIRLTNHLLEPT